MPLPTIEELRLQCRIDTEEEDQLLLGYLDAAKEKAENYLNRKLYDDAVPGSDPDGMDVTPVIRLTLMLVVGFWYDTRELKKLPQGFYDLLCDYRFSPMREK
ncbi:head-tail connector protein [Morganella morganii]|uniref:head-tail connector protein n=1 Tax=Morganella morganii TaxID=582 RepID=UPI001BDA4A84|nr:head-tail connector protein [Morganella morganii]MBT0422307.1 phage gp6-like head-tail connector protein [Morganella morganii subsp. morganii]MBT0517042.1 phage gp6-like head-tail connector protein [Morganella morganii subsp. morganii]QWM05398.1 phage gp6-like head-tail connector protein [Morganella morganii subsp. morganii]